MDCATPKRKSFRGISENDVRTKIYIAIITYALIAIIKVRLILKQSPYEILQIVSVSMLNKTHYRVFLKTLYTLKSKNKILSN